MQSLADFFRPLDPFSKQPSWGERDFPGETLRLRPVYIPDDLRILHRWIHAATTQINTVNRGDPGRLLSHYQNILHSSRAQSFVLLKNEIPVCQFDVKGTETDPLYFLLPTRADDGVLKCLIPAASLESGVWTGGLKLLLDLFFSLANPGEVFIEAPRYPQGFSEGLRNLGFEACGEFEELDPLLILLKTKTRS